MLIKFKKLYEDVELPEYATSGSVGFDIKSHNAITLAPEGMGIIYTGLAVEIPENTELTIRQRSGISKTYPNYISIGIGTIDWDYRGEIMIPVVNNNPFDNFVIEKGMRIAQCILSPVIRVEIKEVKELNMNTERGTGGFGSTGE
jgi:dUTP pyrophosphatase